LLVRPSLKGYSCAEIGMRAGRITDPVEKARLRGWRWKTPEHTHASPWAQGSAPDDLPTTSIADPYIVPPAATLPEIVALKTDDAQLLKGLESSGAHLTPAWRAATEWQEQARVERPLMPPSGVELVGGHIALIMPMTVR
jgi:hypothetical protein